MLQKLHKGGIRGKLGEYSLFATFAARKLQVKHYINNYHSTDYKHYKT